MSDSQKLLGPKSRSTLVALAKKQGLSVAVVKAKIARIGFVASAPRGAGGRPGNISVELLPGTIAVPTADAIAAQFHALQFSTHGIDVVATPLGVGTLVIADSVAFAARRVYIEVLYLEISRGIVSLSFAMPTASRTADLRRSILPTLQDID